MYGSIYWIKGSGQVKNCIWKAFHEILPIKMNLYARNVIDYALCPVCLQEEESVWRCLASSDVWSEQNSPMGKWPCAYTNFFELWKKITKELKKEKLYVVTIITRRIWNRRNALVFRNHFESPKMVSVAIAILEDFQQAQEFVFEIHGKQ